MSARSGFTLVRTPPFPNTKEAKKKLSEMLERRGLTAKQARNAYELFRELHGLGMLGGAFSALAEELEQEE